MESSRSKGNPIRKLCVLLCVLVSLPLAAQTTTKRKAKPTATVETTDMFLPCGPYIHDGEPCIWHSVPTPAPTPAPPSVGPEVIEAMQVFVSTIEVGVNKPGLTAALIPLKVKVDRLPDAPETASLKGILAKFLDANEVWGVGVFARHGVTFGQMNPYIAKYQSAWQRAVSGNPNGIIFNKIATDDVVVAFARFIFTDAQEELKDEIKSLSKETK